MPKHHIALFTVAALVGSFPSLAQDSGKSLEELSSLARPSTVYLTVQHVDPSNSENVCTETTQGTAFVISSDGYALSALHNVRTPKACPDFTRLKIEGRIGHHKTAPALPLSVVGRDSDADAALLRFAERDEPYDHAPICNLQDIKAGREFAAFGFPKGTGFSPLPTVYSNADGDAARWVASSNFTHGVSGGPVYDYSGKVVGIVQGGLKNTPAVRFIVPLRHAVNMIDLSGVSLEKCSSEAVASSADKGSQVISAPGGVAAGTITNSPITINNQSGEVNCNIKANQSIAACDDVTIEGDVNLGAGQ